METRLPVRHPHPPSETSPGSATTAQSRCPCLYETASTSLTSLDIERTAVERSRPRTSRARFVVLFLTLNVLRRHVILKERFERRRPIHTNGGVNATAAAFFESRFFFLKHNSRAERGPRKKIREAVTVRRRQKNHRGKKKKRQRQGKTKSKQ